MPKIPNFSLSLSQTQIHISLPLPENASIIIITSYLIIDSRRLQAPASTVASSVIIVDKVL